MPQPRQGLESCVWSTQQGSQLGNSSQLLSAHYASNRALRQATAQSCLKQRAHQACGLPAPRVHRQPASLTMRFPLRGLHEMRPSSSCNLVYYDGEKQEHDEVPPQLTSEPSWWWWWWGWFPRWGWGPMRGLPWNRDLSVVWARGCSWHSGRG